MAAESVRVVDELVDGETHWFGTSGSVVSNAGCQATEPPLPSTSAFAPEFRSELRATIRTLFVSSASLSVVFIFVLFLFFGSGWRSNDPTLLRNLKFAVVDNDNGLIGSALTAAALDGQQAPTYFLLRNVTLPDLIRRVHDGSFHAALVAAPGASTALLAAAADASVPYDAAAAIAVVFDEGRGGALLASLIPALAGNLVSATSAGVARSILQMNAHRPVSELNPAAVVNPVASTTVNLHPVYDVGAQGAVGLSFIDYWIIMLAATNVQLGLCNKWEEKGIRRDHQVIARWIFELLVAGILSFWPPVVFRVLAGSAPMLLSRAFFAWWAFCWLSMFTFGMCITGLLRNLGLELGNQVHTVFLILNLVSSGGVTPTELMPPFFRIGLGLPFYNAVQGSRHIVFGSYNRIGRNVGIQVTWCVVVAAFGLYKLVRARRELRAAGKLDGEKKWSLRSYTPT